MKLTKLHRVLEFVHKTCMEQYIHINTELRKLAINDFEKDLYRLMNNFVFGKTRENSRKSVDVKLLRSN